MPFPLTTIIFYPFLILITFMCIMGFGTLFNFFIKDNENYLDLNNITFFKGLILVGIICNGINFFLPINNYVTLIIIIFGIFFYLFNFYYNKNKVNKLLFVISVVVFSFIFSFYSGVSDDFIYHLETVKNFKNKNIFEIDHHRMISYNSFWLFLNSIFTLDNNYSTIFILGALVYSICILDFYFLYKKSILNDYYYTGIYSFFVVIFLLGVINNYKDFGTDIPGVIISFYVFILVSFRIFDEKENFSTNWLIILLLLIQFVFIIKLTNALLFLFLTLLFLNYKFVKIKSLYIILTPLITLLWFFQNYNISGCIVWPIDMLCLNNDRALNEIYLIKSFARGDIAVSINITDFKWILLWLKTHSHKLIETYLIYFLLLLTPIVIIYLKSNIEDKIKLISIKKILFNLNYILLISIILLSNIVWFFYAPAYRFGIFYNLNLILIFILPFWINIFKNKLNLITRICTVYIFLISSYFLYENIKRIDWYSKKYDIWPPIINDQLIPRK